MRVNLRRFRGKYVILRYRGGVFIGYLRKNDDCLSDQYIIGQTVINVKEVEEIHELKES